jgi:hypothetical protein
MKGAAATHNSNVATTVATTVASDILVAINVSEGVSGCDDAAQGAVHHRCHLSKRSPESTVCGVFLPQTTQFVYVSIFFAVLGSCRLYIR